MPALPGVSKYGALMGRPRRHFNAKNIYLIRNFCAGYQARFLPEEELNKVIWGLLLKFARSYGIKLYAFVFMQSYFEILLQAPEENLNHFMCHFQCELSKALNRLQGRRGSTFPHRYTDEVVMEDRVEDVVSEIIGRPCTDNLVAHPAEWPGVSSWRAHQSGEEMVGYWTESEDYWLLRRRYSEDEYSDETVRDMAATEYRMALARLPGWKELDVEACREKIDAFARAHAEERASVWEHYGWEDETGRKMPPPGVSQVLACPIDRQTHPCHPIRRGRCLTWCSEARAAFYAARQAANARYTGAASRMRRGSKRTYFPAGMIPPGHLHCVGSPGAVAAGENPQAPEEIDANTSARAEHG